jgi:hypothetical protein
MLSLYAQKMQQQLKIGRDVSEKLVPNLLMVSENNRTRLTNVLGGV